jgi:PBP4 family serine-type D-alanyl-D-alanine carboxypeptidase
MRFISPKSASPLTATLVLALLAITLRVSAQTTVTAPELAAEIGPQLEKILTESAVSERTNISVYVEDLESGEVIFEQGKMKLMTPASVMKMYSSACALDTFGPAHQFTTKIGTTAPKNTAGVVDGSIVVRGGGDPVLRAPQLLNDLVRKFAVTSRIRTVSGGVVVDASLYENRLKGPGWMWDDDPDYYNMSVTPLMVDYNVMSVGARPTRNASNPVNAEMRPPSDYPTFEVGVTLQETPGKLSIDRKPFSDVITITGTVAPGQGVASRTLTMHNPSRWIAGMVQHNLTKRNGVSFGADPSVAYESTGELHHVIEHKSAPMGEILALFNKPSENAIGEVLLHNLAINNGSKKASWNAGARVIRSWLSDTVGLSAQDYRLVDGSGLSRYNLINAAGTVKLLKHMWNHPHKQVYVDSLPNAGADGTLRNRMKDPAVQDRVFAKTGTMSGASCIAGYIRTHSDRWLAFAILTNGYVGSSTPSRGLQDQLMITMTKHGM